ncbi:unnamed protein product [Lactuca virosa]|uniref:Uncharacterized protein n=1 Tax=Lactuca virosa TaxID=75947 RepID=A0AAU9P6N0_9ASTR|nr:unnamed protein product [Lactuca virosa]
MYRSSEMMKCKVLRHCHRWRRRPEKTMALSINTSHRSPCSVKRWLPLLLSPSPSSSTNCINRVSTNKSPKL